MVEAQIVGWRFNILEAYKHATPSCDYSSEKAISQEAWDEYEVSGDDEETWLVERSCGAKITAGSQCQT